jgi:CheY-like chemotaxis protein
VTEARASILVVDDDRINRMVLSRDLEREGHRVATVEDGGRALEALRAEPFDVVLLDVLMPELDGYEDSRGDRARREAAPRSGDHGLGARGHRERRALH